jgi:hypothetical protein
MLRKSSAAFIYFPGCGGTPAITKNRMTHISSFSDFNAHLRRFIAQPANRDFQSLAFALFRLQFENVLPYRRFCESRHVHPEKIQSWKEIPAVPASAFKDLELTSLPAENRTTVFHSSGTTEQRPSRHFHNAESLSLYENSLLRWFESHFLADWDELQREEIVGPLDKPGLIFLTPSPALAPHSSLVHMFKTIRRELGARDSFFAGQIGPDGWELDIEQALFGIRKSMCANRPICILGTAFSFVHLLDFFAENNMRYKLAAGSRVMETGGYKGRSRTMPKSELHALITKHLGVPASHIVCEYGMSELSSQAYDRTIQWPIQSESGKNLNRVFQFPPWAKVQIISPETGKEVGEGETGLIQIFDLANAYSAMAIQTEDLGIRRGEGFELIGRATASEPRGCSLMPASI